MARLIYYSDLILPTYKLVLSTYVELSASADEGVEDDEESCGDVNANELSPFREESLTKSRNNTKRKLFIKTHSIPKTYRYHVLRDIKLSIINSRQSNIISVLYQRYGLRPLSLFSRGEEKSAGEPNLVQTSHYQSLLLS